MRCDGYELRRQGEELILSVLARGKEGLEKEAGVVRVGDLLEKRYPASRFHFEKNDMKKVIELFRSQCDFSFGMSGYSNVDQKRCNELGIKLGQYEYSVAGLMKRAIGTMRQRISSVRPGIVYGSSEMGVDLAIGGVAEQDNIPLLGTSCLAYLWYVNNKPVGPNILIARTKQEYNELYVGLIDLLLAANGGQVSYDMDIHAATRRMIPVVPVDVLSMLGSKVPAFIVDSSGGRKVNDAVGALIYTWRLLDWTSAGFSHAKDRFEEVSKQFSDAVVAAAREVAPAKYSFT